MLDALLNILNGFTDIPFVELAWSHAPDDKYGVITLDNQIPLNADADPVSEKMLTGFVDVFVKKPKDLSTISSVENALKQLGIWFALNSVQFEDDTGYVHYEWEWRDSTNVVSEKLYVVKFHAHGGYVGEPQIVPYGGEPDAPTSIPDYTEDGITYSPNEEWNPSTSVGVTQNTVYEKSYHAVITLVNSLGRGFGLLAKNGDYPFTNEQINTLIAWFDNGGKIVCKKSGLLNKDVTDITTSRVYYDGGFSNWYVPEVWVSNNNEAFKKANVAFTTDEIDYMIEWFNNGGRIIVWLYNGNSGTDASGISTECIAITNGLIQFPWAR